MNAAFADKIQMQHVLFAELSNMFGKEVPLYDKSLLVNRECNQTVCALLSKLYPGFSLSEQQLDKTSGERHGAIRIGKPDEYRWIAGFFAAFGMEPHNYYDMTNVGSKSQPIVATAFRSKLNPEHRIFCSLLMTDYFDPATSQRIEAVLATRQVFSEKAKALVEKNEKQGGLSDSDARDLIHEGTTRIFKWTGKARDHQLYQDLSAAGFKIAADIACFGSHHLNHLTPNTFCMDFYTASMKFCMGELDATGYTERATRALQQLVQFADRDYLKLHFKHFSLSQIEAFGHGNISSEDIVAFVAQMVTSLKAADLDLTRLKHAGFKDFTEGPAEDTPILLRQDAYKALTEPVTFQEQNGSTVETVHTARFGEVEQRFYATTPAGRELYDKCLAAAETMKEQNGGLIKKDFAAYQKAYAQCFAPFPKKLSALLSQKLVYGRFSPSAKGLEAANRKEIKSGDVCDLLQQGFIQVEGLRYEDFLPVSAAGIFASNLGQYGTKSTAAVKPVYQQEQLEQILGRSIVDSHKTYQALEAESLLTTFKALGILDQVPEQHRASWEKAATSLRA